MTEGAGVGVSKAVGEGDGLSLRAEENPPKAPIAISAIPRRMTSSEISRTALFAPVLTGLAGG